jgi:hypothetical protein
MAAPVYATDLADITLNEALGTWVETGTWTTGTNPVLEPDFFIQGANCVAKYWTTGGGGGTPGGAIFDAGSALTIPSPGAFFIWLKHQCPNDIDTEANGGLRVLMGDSSTAFNGWKIRGSDTYRYGGWFPAVVDPAVTKDYTIGAPVEDSTRQWFGAAYMQLATAKGGMGMDALRYGRGELRCTNGDVTNGYASFGGSAPDGGAAAYDNATTRAWGMLSPKDGSFFQQGLFIMGLAGTAVDFRDANRTLFILDTKKVVAAFNGFEIRHASSRVDWTNISVSALGTVSRGTFVVTDNADVNLNTCVFSDLDTFAFLAASAALNCTFRRCNAITAGGANLTGSTVDAATVAADTSALIWNVATDPDGLLNDMAFIKGGNAHHAIEFGTSSPLTITLRGIDFSGFHASNAQNDSTFHVKRTTDTVTINVIGCTGNFSYKTAGATVTIVANPVTTLVTVKNAAGANVENARVRVEASDGAGDLPYLEAVTITRSGATATVSHTAHGLNAGDKVVIRGAVQQEYNGVFAVANVSANAYDYTVGGAPATPATGSITATGAVLEGLTNASGQISASRVFSMDQNVRGTARKSTSSPYYKASEFTDVVDSVAGLTKTVQLVLDE